ncbi:tyrosine-type recombinase/integrase [Magnetofaba australis]|uniref:Putative integrase family protein n=1 Tax=Magnetofaba australis IT-1 TaxID=1434232 RepID=A0A1Y2JZY1_9PROT|nr:site-specific integrase [Magnetofaba australis]OSM00399.1 putative integrase family protein [Magnetofaba australis IT-1]
MPKFTDRYLKNLKPADKRRDILEGDGFGVRVTPAGAKTFYFTWRDAGRMRRLTLGAYPALSLADARRLAAEARNKVKAGTDPIQERQEAEAEKLAAPTVGDLVEMFLTRYAKPHKAARTASEYERMLRKDILPRWGRRKAEEIKRRDVVAMLDELTARGCTVTANRTFSVTRRLFSWAMEAGILEYTPCLGVKAPAKESRKNRVLTEAEIKTFWSMLDEASISPLSAAALRLTLATCQRSGEALQMRWSDLDDEWWTIPAHVAKNRRAHRVFLNAVARDVLASLPRTSEWVFPSPRHGCDRIQQNALGHALKLNEWLGLPRFGPHDLRRTGATMMVGLGVPRLIVGKLLNHVGVDREITGVYDLHSYSMEMQSALETWGRRLQEVISGKTAANVISLRATK